MSEKPIVEIINGTQRPNISFNKRLLYSDTSTPEKRVEGLPKASQALYIVTSPLLFYGIENLINLVPEGSKILAIEHNQELFDLSVDIYMQNFSDVIDYTLIDNNSIEFIFEIIKTHRLRRIIPVKLNHGYMIGRNYYDSILRKSETFLSNFWKNRMTTIHMGRLWCRNIILNTSFLKKAAWVSEIKTDKPVLSIGAGESLERNIKFIKGNRKQFFLTAADTAVSTLLLNGIKPDLVIALEAQHANLYDFYEDESLDLPVAADLTSSPELLRKIRGPLYFFISEFDYSCLFRILKDYSLLPPVLPPLGSVGITSLLLSMMITKNWIIFTGLDFSFIPDKYHARCAPSHILSSIGETRMKRTGFFDSAYSPIRKKCRDKSGRLVYTDLIMESYSETLNQIIAKSGRIVDIGEFGLKTSAPLHSDKEILSFLSTKPESRNEIELSNTVMDSENVIKFLNKEKDKLEVAVSLVVDFQNSRKSTSKLTHEAMMLLNDLDYTWLFFPDKKPLPSSDASFLKRFLFSSSWFKNQISNTISLINPQS